MLTILSYDVKNENLDKTVWLKSHNVNNETTDLIINDIKTILKYEERI